VAARLVAALAGGIALLATTSDPAHDLSRVRLLLTTTSGDAAVTITGATLASYNSGVIAGSGSVRTTHGGSSLAIGGNVRGQSAEAEFDVVLADVPSAAVVTWNVSAAAGSDTTLEVYSTNDPGHPQLVDRFSTRDAAAAFTTAAGLLDSHGTVRVSPFSPRLVLAHFYPWYTVDTWSSPQLADRPARLYSTDSLSDLRVISQQAQSAGINAFAVSWAGIEVDDTSDRRLRLALDAAGTVGFKACAFTETNSANARDDAQALKDPQVMLDWLAHLTDTFGSHPAYLRVGSRPVILIYSASVFDVSTWSTIADRLRASGRNPVLIGDFFHSRLIEALDGEYQYSNVTLAPADLATVYRTETLRVRTWNLLAPGDARRIWVASVAPGYDDTRLTNRSVHTVVDRAAGLTYDQQWAVALHLAPDWVIITSWNEWYENSEIEPGARYGSLYLDKTRLWTRAFRYVTPAPAVTRTP
jgi:Glycosyl hydrolase family 99